MRLTVERRYKCNGYTIGRLHIDGVRFCDTLEDADRGLDSSMSIQKLRRMKVYGETAIPTGTYHIDMNTVSPKFKNRPWAKKYGGIVPRLLAVPCYSGVLIHVGTDQNSTLGCIIVGENKVKGKVVNSAKTFEKLMDLLIFAKEKKEEITIEIK